MPASSASDDSTRRVTRKAIQGTLWTYLSYIAGKLLSFVTTVILARLLLPEEFGLVGYATVVIQYLDVVNTLGMGTAVISRRDRLAEAANAAFYISIAVGAVLYGMAWLGAPLAATYFREPLVTPMLRVIALLLPLNAVSVIPGALIQRDLRFGIKIIPDLSSSLAKGAVSILMAWQGFGAWSLIWGQIASVFVAGLLHWALAGWRPTRVFDRRITREMLSFGGHIIAVGFIGALLNNVDYLIIGRMLGAVALGVYTLAYRMPELVIRSINLVVGRVAHPVLSTVQMSAADLRAMYRRYLRYTALIIFPAGVGVALLSGPIIRVFYTARWAAAIPVMRWIALAVTIAAMGHIPGVLYKSINRPDILNKLALVKLPVVIGVLWFATRWGIEGVALGHVALALFKVTLDTLVASRFVQAGVWDVLRAIYPALVGTLVMGLAVWGLLFIFASGDVRAIVLGTATGALVYLAALLLVRRDVVLNTAGVVWDAMRSLRAG